MPPKTKPKASKPADTRAALIENLKKVGAVLNTRPQPLEYISTGNNYLDAVTGGGLARKRVTEIWGFPGSGKTTIAKIVVRTCMIAGLKVAWCDTEATFSEAWAWKLGVPIDLEGENGDYLLDFPYPAEPKTATMETWLSIILELVKANQHDLIVIDTWAHMSPRAEQETPMDKSARMGVVSQLTTRLYRMLSPWLPVSKCALLVINQVRNQFGDEYNPFTSPGGWAMHHEASMRIQMFYPQTDWWDEDRNDPKQHTFRFYITKTKVSNSSKKLHSIMLVNDESREFWEYDQLAAIWDSVEDLDVFQNVKGEPWKAGSNCFFDVVRWDYPETMRSTEKKDYNSSGWMKLGSSKDEIKARISGDPAMLACVMAAVAESINGNGANDAQDESGSGAEDHPENTGNPEVAEAGVPFI